MPSRLCAGSSKGHMSETQWYYRLILMETVGSLPGIVGGLVRHLRSLMVLERDRGGRRCECRIVV